MIYLLDSNALRDLMDAHPRLSGRVSRATTPDVIAVCSIVRGEVLFGIERLPAGQRRERLAATAASLLGSFEEMPVPYAAGDVDARLKRERERAGLPMDENDLWIAATALATGAVLVTRDQDFGPIGGLTIEDWTA